MSTVVKQYTTAHMTEARPTLESSFLEVGLVHRPLSADTNVCFSSGNVAIALGYHSDLMQHEVVLS
ncbi:hypothetical protein PG993_010508 [Apiospora rasikravindrae]|uniref:Uncharacterized protein n=1 Tax=Apiospora rasikravindrae TaxID=990691 RepID=A0ABR1SMF8_9PEZI